MKIVVHFHLLFECLVVNYLLEVYFTILSNHKLSSA